MTTSREKFLSQLERCVKHQNMEIAPPSNLPYSTEEIYASTEFIPEEPSGNGVASVETNTQSVWGLRPPGDDTPLVEPYIGDWA